MELRDRDAWLREPVAARLDRLSADFAAIASWIAERRPEAALSTMFTDTETRCRWTADTSAEPVRSLLINLTQPLQTWRQVWSRLGEQPEFRQAVIREAELWSRRLHALKREQSPDA